MTGRVDLIANAKDYVGGSCQPSWTLLSVFYIFLFERIIDLRSGLRRVLKSSAMARRLLYTQQVLAWVLVSCTITLALRAAHSTVCCIYVHTAAAAAGHDMEGEGKEVEDLIIFWGGNWLAVSETKFRQGQIQNSRICAQSALTELPGNSFSSPGYPTHTRRQQRAKQINRKQIFK